MAMDSDGPGSNKVDGDFVPWLSRKVFGWELTTRGSRQFLALAGVAGLDKGVAGGTKFRCIEVGGNGLVEALGTGMALTPCMATMNWTSVVVGRLSLGIATLILGLVNVVVVGVLTTTIWSASVGVVLGVVPVVLTMIVAVLVGIVGRIVSLSVVALVGTVVCGRFAWIEFFEHEEVLFEASEGLSA